MKSSFAYRVDSKSFMTFHRYDSEKWWSNGYDRSYEKSIPWNGICSTCFPYGLDPPLHDQVVFQIQKCDDLMEYYAENEYGFSGLPITHSVIF